MRNIPKIIYLNQDYLGIVEEDDFNKAQWTWCDIKKFPETLRKREYPQISQINTKE